MYKFILFSRRLLRVQHWEGGQRYAPAEGQDHDGDDVDVEVPTRHHDVAQPEQAGLAVLR